MLQNAYLNAKIGVDPAENEPRRVRVLCHGRGSRLSQRPRVEPVVAEVRRAGARVMGTVCVVRLGAVVRQQPIGPMLHRASTI